MDLEERIAKTMELVKLTQKGLGEASERASEFLIIQALIANEIRETSEDLAKLYTIESGTLHDCVSKSSAKGVTEKKMEAARNPKYTNARESKEVCDAKITWLKTYLKIFDNAHITYRQHSKDI